MQQVSSGQLHGMWVYHPVKVIFKHHVAGYSSCITWSKNVCKLSRVVEHYSHNSVTLPLPIRGNSHLVLKILDCQFCSYGPMIFCTVWSKSKYKISGKRPLDQPLLVSVVLSFVQLHLLLCLCLVNIHNVFGPHRDANFTAHPPKDFDRCPLLSRCIGKQTLAKA